jgi:hypothetical protein
MQQETSSEWARKITLEAFASSGVKLREDDSIILVAAVFRRALDEWLDSSKEALDSRNASLLDASGDLAQMVRSVIAEEFGAQSSRLRRELLEDAESASMKADTAVKAALAIPEQRNQWRARMEGVFLGGGLVLLGAILMHWLGH